MDRRSGGITPRDLECMLLDEMADPKALPLSLLEEITCGFSDEQEIGRGGFAVVYKGMLENTTVAVKRMSNTYMYEKEFQQEVECLMMVKHKNIVRFLGYCADTQGNMARCQGKFVMADVQQRLLCFEYLPKGSLVEYITDTTSGLQWRDRYHIIKGICQGLHYLHQKNIVHLDLKPGNILLDGNWEAKIADFGLSRCFDEMQSRIVTMKIGGTLGYLAPEFGNGEITYQFDIYSLGVIIIEILTGKKGYHDVDKVVESWSSMLEKSQSEVQLEEVRVCAEIGIKCTDFNPSKRPDTHHIVGRLKEIESTDEYIETRVTTSQQQINPYMLNDAMRAFWFSHQQLHPDLKRCIEYCSIFPKGSKLRSDKLIFLWIAQGFVNTGCATKDMEVVAESYFQELLSCSFLQPEGTIPEWFTIPDALHDLLYKFAGDCFRIENAMSDIGEGWEEDVPQDVQHLFVQKYDEKLITQKILGLKSLLTLIVYVVEKDTSVEEKVIDGIFKELPDLRVLAVAFSQEHDPIEQPNKFSVPESISQVKQLRYFAFRTSQSCTIIVPSGLNDLENVQLLDFGAGKISKFTFADLITLRHIICKSWANFANIGSLVSLQTLPEFTMRNEQGYEVKQLKDLNKLHGRLSIGGLENIKSKEEALEANLVAKERLTKLVLQCGSREYNRHSPEVEAEVLEGLCPPVGLQELHIKDYGGLRYADWMVGSLNGGPKDLQRLELFSCGRLGCPAPELDEAFPHLRVLKLWGCVWNDLPGNMENLTSLKELVIFSCENIRLLPTLPQSLKKFCLLDCSADLMESCQTSGDPNWKKIQHIPYKFIHVMV